MTQRKPPYHRLLSVNKSRGPPSLLKKRMTGMEVPTASAERRQRLSEIARLPFESSTKTDGIDSRFDQLEI